MHCQSSHTRRRMRKGRQSFVVHWLKPERGGSAAERRWKPWMVAGSTARRGKPVTGVWWDYVESAAVVVSAALPRLASPRLNKLPSCASHVSRDSPARCGKPWKGVWWDYVESAAVMVSIELPCLGSLPAFACSCQP